VVDRAPAKRLLAAVAVVSISASALLLALWPTFSAVVIAKILHAIATALLIPTLVAISLGLVGYAPFSERLGRNVRLAGTQPRVSSRCPRFTIASGSD
jgi:predicted MFS family arabinose efflux permease